MKKGIKNKKKELLALKVHPFPLIGNSLDPREMTHNELSHPEPHCLQRFIDYSC